MAEAGTGTDSRFHSLVEGTAAALLVFNRERILYVNPAANNMTGYSAKELTSMALGDLIDPNAGDQADEIAAQFEHGQETRYRIKIRRKSGRSRWLDLRCSTFEYRGEAAVLATAFDISEFRRTEAAKKEQEAQLRLVQKAGRTVTWDWKILSDELLVSGLTRELFPGAQESLQTTSATLFEFVHPEDIHKLKSALRRAMQEGDPVFEEVRVIHPEGSVSWIVLRGQAVGDKFGSPEHLVGVATDVTRRRRAEEAAFREKEQAQAMLASIGDGVIRLDRDETINYMSPAAERLTGWDFEEAQGKSAQEVVQIIDARTREPISTGDEIDERPPVDPEEKYLLIRRNDEEVEVRHYRAVTRDQNNEISGFVLVLKDLSELKRVERGMVYLATHDGLTDLVNRREFERRLQQALESAQRENREHALCYLDLDGFKFVNDSCGHLAGDRMLKQFGSFLKTRFRETDTLGRLGGDEFAILLEDCPPWRAREVVTQLYRELRSFRFTWEKKIFSVSVSMGLVALNSQSGDLDHVLGHADAACYVAKEKGGDRVHEYRAKDLALTERYGQLRVVEEIHEALSEDRFELYYQYMQPLVRSTDPPIYEVLIRMLDRNGEVRLPGSFIPVAERHRLVSAIDRWVVRRALETITGEGAAIISDDASLTINISGQSLGDDRFLEFVLREVEHRAVAPERVCFEITETATVSDLDRALRFMSVLRGRGCRFILDDFGSGLSSFAYLRSFPVDFIKIDGQFVKSLTKDPIQRALVESINHVGHVMQMKTIAESVEDEESLKVLQELGVDYAQGYWIATPAPLRRLRERASHQSGFLSST